MTDACGSAIVASPRLRTSSSQCLASVRAPPNEYPVPCASALRLEQELVDQREREDEEEHHEANGAGIAEPVRVEGLLEEVDAGHHRRVRRAALAVRQDVDADVPLQGLDDRQDGDQFDLPHDEGHIDAEDARPGRGAIEARGVHDILRDILQPGEVDEHVGAARPRELDHHVGPEGGVRRGEPEFRLLAEMLEHVVEESLAGHRVVEVLPQEQDDEEGDDGGDEHEDAPELLRPLAGEVENRLGDDDRHREGDRQVEDEDDEDILQRPPEGRVVQDLLEVGEADEVVDPKAVPIVERLLEDEEGRPVLEYHEEHERGQEKEIDQPHPPDALPDIRGAARPGGDIRPPCR